MMITRRKFIFGTGSIVAACPAMAGMFSLPVGDRADAARPPIASPALAPAEQAESHGVAFQIEGWSVGEVAPAAGVVLISVNQGWRAAWR